MGPEPACVSAPGGCGCGWVDWVECFLFRGAVGQKEDEAVGLWGGYPHGSSSLEETTQ